MPRVFGEFTSLEAAVEATKAKGLLKNYTLQILPVLPDRAKQVRF